MDGGFDFSHKLKRITCFIIGIFQLIYQLLDNLDGKQARRTGNSTPFGMLMDHGCDVFTNIFTAFNLSKLLLVGNDDYFSYSVFFGLLVGFYIMTLEEYKLASLKKFSEKTEIQKQLKYLEEKEKENNGKRN